MLFKTEKNAITIQFETWPKTCLVQTNYLHASCFGTDDLTMQDDDNRSCVSHAMTNSFLFKQFMAGCHCRMGNVWLPDKSVSYYIIGGCFRVLERNWNDIWDRGKGNIFALRCVATAACVIIAGYFRGLISTKWLLGNKDVHINKSLKTGCNSKALHMDTNPRTAYFFGVK